MAFGVSRSLTTCLLLLNLCIYTIILGIVGWPLNKAIDHGAGRFLVVSDNPATPYFVIFALIDRVICYAGASAATAWIAWMLTLLALGFDGKELHEGGHKIKRMKAMEAFVIIAAVTQLLYLHAVHGGILKGEYGDGEGYRGSSPKAQKGESKHL